MQDNSEPRIVTEREIFDSQYLSTWRVCMDMANRELTERGVSYDTDNLLTATAQLFICWNQNRANIDYLKRQRQAEIDKRFGVQKSKKEGNNAV